MAVCTGYTLDEICFKVRKMVNNEVVFWSVGTEVYLFKFKDYNKEDEEYYLFLTLPIGMQPLQRYYDNCISYSHTRIYYKELTDTEESYIETFLPDLLDSLDDNLKFLMWRDE